MFNVRNMEPKTGPFGRGRSQWHCSPNFWEPSENYSKLIIKWVTSIIAINNRKNTNGNKNKSNTSGGTSNNDSGAQDSYGNSNEWLS